MLLPPESTEYRHENQVCDDVGLYLNGYAGYAADTIIGRQGGSVSIEAADRMTGPIPKGARR
ncbi:MAG TPA: hypothetical protein VN367_00975 [Chlorobaculum sp.]|jgi:hypothetical protein|nr:hypothetical protein [Chlorobaculum sp.]